MNNAFGEQRTTVLNDYSVCPSCFATTDRGLHSVASKDAANRVVSGDGAAGGGASASSCTAVVVSFGILPFMKWLDTA